MTLTTGHALLIVVPARPLETNVLTTIEAQFSRIIGAAAVLLYVKHLVCA